MDANARRRGGSGGRTLAVAAAVIVLVAVVAVASGGSTPSGAVGAHRPSEGFLDAIVSLFVVGMAIATVLVVVMVSFFGRYQSDGSARKRKSPVQSVVTFIVAMALLTIVVRSLAGSVGPRLRPPAPQGAAGGGGSERGASGYEPDFVVWPVLAVAALAAVAVVAWWLAARGRRRAREPLGTTPAEALADVLAETLDDLRAERDPRRAVIAAYARMERALAASGLPRDPAEAPEEYLRRILSDVAVTGPRAATRLTSLFAWARFSGHDVRPEMKDEAIETLEQVQRELAAADAARHAELAGAAA